MEVGPDYKILFLGDPGVGKSCMLRHYSLGQKFQPKYKRTIGFDVGVKVIFRGGGMVRICLWDIAGKGEDKLCHIFRQEACGAFLFFDVSRPDTWSSLPEWKKRYAEDPDIPVILVATKTALIVDPVYVYSDGWEERKEGMDAFCAEHGLLGWFASSLKEGEPPSLQTWIDLLLDQADRSAEEELISSFHLV